MIPAEIERQVERFKAALLKAGIRQTHQRLTIYREVLARDDHPDVDSVYQSVRKQLPQISRDTIYRTLWTATDLGLLGTLGPREAKVRFDGNPRPHHHFVCKQCSAIFDFESPELDELRLPMAASALGEIDTATVELRGLCRRCATAPATAPQLGRAEE